MSLAEVKTIYETNIRDIPAKLRELADEIEKARDGRYGEVRELAFVAYGDQLSVFGLGEADATTTHTLLCAGARCIEEPFVRLWR